MFDLRDKETLYATKEEGEPSSSSRQWSSGMKNPRIVRVSRTFGGKDRHSKVTTIKGLRDRRIRLSVSTAIQLYDLQDRLGLGQPSKVIDWLLDSTKLDIDKLPPLPPIPGHFPPFQQDIHSCQGFEMPLSSSYPFMDANFFLSSRREGININNLSVGVNEDPSIVAKLKYWDSKRKQIDVDDDDDDKVLAQNLFPIASSNNNNASIVVPNSSSSSSLLSNNHPMYNYYQYWEPCHHQSNSSNSSSIPSPLTLSSSSSQLYPSPSMETSSLFPQHTSFNHLQVESDDIRQFNRFNLSNNPYPSSMYTSTGLGLKPFPFSMSQQPHFRQDKDNDGNSWKESSRN
ncbi:hypothetical protein RND81_10G212200 [Saponaria officinalis]|uniref:TCP domain-containing protein n=1 Tax=Saponaria officinalis TaxID=3572 RepID=A0AAW1I769_SAPOF